MAYTGGNWAGSWALYGMPLPVLAVLLYVSRFKLPAMLAAALVSIAAASYHIYLLHRILPEACLIAPIPRLLPRRYRSKYRSRPVY